MNAAELSAGWLFLGAAFWLSGCSNDAPSQRAQAPAGAPNMILISVDSLRPDHLGCYGYPKNTSPFIDSLAEGGLLFENALSTTSWTLPAHAALFTGLRDSVHGLYDNGKSLSEAHVTLAEALFGGGYQTAGFFGGPYLHPAFGLGQGFEVYGNCMSERPSSGSDVREQARSGHSASHADRTGPRTREAIAAWAQQAAGSQRPYFLFIHLWDVHYDYIAPEEYVSLFASDYEGPVDGQLMANPAIQEGMSVADRAYLMALYDAEIRFTDDVLRGIFEDLEARGMLENSLVVLTADHGEEFFEHGQKGHNKTLFDEVLRVPMIVNWKGKVLPGTRTDLQVQLIDLMPTLAKLASVPLERAVQGRDLGVVLKGGQLVARDALAELLIDGQSYRALRSNQRKVIQLSQGAPAFLADLSLHPDEKLWIRPGAADDPGDEKKRAHAQLELQRAIMKSASFAGALEAGELERDGGLERRLQALGYLGDDDE